MLTLCKISILEFRQTVFHCTRSLQIGFVRLSCMKMDQRGDKFPSDVNGEIPFESNLGENICESVLTAENIKLEMQDEESKMVDDTVLPENVNIKLESAGEDCSRLHDFGEHYDMKLSEFPTMEKINVNIKSEPVNDFYETDNPGFSVDVERYWDEDNLDPLAQNTQARTIISMEKKSSENAIKCEVEDTQILGDAGRESNYSLGESVQGPSGLTNKGPFEFVNMPTSLEKHGGWDIKKEDFNSHKSLHLKCADCDKNFSTLRTLCRHRNKQHLNIKPHKCPDCEKCFTHKCHLRVHQDTVHYKLKQFKCLDCDKSYYNKQNLEYHQMSQHLKVKPYKCTDCERSFIDKTTLRYHQEAVHHKLKPHSCPECGSSYHKKQNLDYHRLSQHLKVKPHKCNECEKSYYNKRDLKYHQISQHLKIEPAKPHKCSDCGSSFTRRNILRRHREAVHNKLKTHKCPDCDKIYNRKETLKRHHMSQHLKIKPEECPDCHKGFTRKTHLARHQNAVHRKLRPFKCTFCEKSFHSKQNLGTHQMSQHLKVINPIVISAAPEEITSVKLEAFEG